MSGGRPSGAGDGDRDRSGARARVRGGSVSGVRVREGGAGAPAGAAQRGDRPDDLAPRLQRYEGRPAAVNRTGKDPVNLPMIRHWCEAMGDTNPAYQGPDAIAPPTMLQAWTMGGLSGHSEGAAGTEAGAGAGASTRSGTGTGAFDELMGLLEGAGYTSVVATDCEQEYPRPLRPGDVITYDSVIESVSARKTTRLGTGYFVTTRMDIRVGDEVVGTHRFRILKYAPAERPSGGRADVTPSPARRDLRPRPVINRDNAGFWEGVEHGRLLVQRCSGCGAARFPWLPGCNACGSPEWDTFEASGEGTTVYSYVVMHHPPFPAFDPPYAVGLIELAEGVRIVSNVVGVPYDKVRIGMPLRLEFARYEDDADALVLPVFRAREGSGGGHGGHASRGTARGARTGHSDPRQPLWGRRPHAYQDGAGALLHELGELIVHEADSAEEGES